MNPRDIGEVGLQGRTLAGRYVLETELASGGMGTVWRAHDQVLGRPVAVKVLHERLAQDPDILERFRLEAVAAARLAHPNVVRVYDTGIDGEVCFIVMELFDGFTLEDVLRAQGPIPPAEAVRVLRAVLHGLGHAHGQGVIHRDVKPANVLLDRSGLIKVTDFGIAKAAFATSDLTTTGDLLGTAKYLAPEQVAGGGVDHRADLYAAGIVLYESLTGRAPFEGATHIATATMRLTRVPPPPGALRPGIPRRVEAVTMHALARDPSQRFQSAEEMAVALDSAAPGGVPTPLGRTRTEGERPSVFRSWMAVPIGLVILAALALAGFALVVALFDGRGGGAGLVNEEGLQPLEVAEPVSFDPPPGDGQEHDGELALAVDRDLSTVWATDGYSSEGLGGLKDGVGIVFPLSGTQDVAAVRLRTDLPGWGFSVYVADTVDGFDLGAPLQSSGGDDTFRARPRTELAFEPTSAAYVMLWITELTEFEGGYRARVNEVDIFGPGG